MRRLPLVVVWSLVSGQAAAADMELCRPYAAAVADQVVKFAWLRAYSSCLNEDEMPTVPASPVSALVLVYPQPPAPDPPPAPAPIGKSGAPPGSAAWLAWCRQNYPRSFRTRDGTVVQVADRRSHRRTPCPG